MIPATPFCIGGPGALVSWGVNRKQNSVKSESGLPAGLYLSSCGTPSSGTPVLWHPIL